MVSTCTDRPNDYGGGLHYHWCICPCIRQSGICLYGLISLYCCSMVIDSIIYGLDKGSMVMVVSEKNDEIAAQIMDELERGVTLLKGQGPIPVRTGMC